jgi:uncharacterized protein (DUF433 family)
MDWITCTQGVLGGKPCVRGTRISVAFLLELIANGATPESIAATYEDVPVEAVREALRYAAREMRSEAVWSLDIAQ